MHTHKLDDNYIASKKLKALCQVLKYLVQCIIQNYPKPLYSFYRKGNKIT